MKLSCLNLLVRVLLLDGATAAVITTTNRNLETPDNTDPFYYADDVNATGGLADALGYGGRPYTTQSIIRYLPALNGHFQTTNTYRFLTVREQIFNMIGEHKHGLWQVQESGFIREYLAAGASTKKKTLKSHEKTPRVDLIVDSLKRTTEHSQVYIIQNESFVLHVVCV